MRPRPKFPDDFPEEYQQLLAAEIDTRNDAIRWTFKLFARIAVYGGLILIVLMIITPNFGPPNSGYPKSDRVFSNMRQTAESIEQFRETRSRLPDWVRGGVETSANYHWPRYHGAPSLRAGGFYPDDPSTFTLFEPELFGPGFVADPWNRDKPPSLPMGSPFEGYYPFAYYSVNDGYMLVSPGPDGDFDTPFHEFQNAGDEVEMKRFLPYAYHPGRGAKSGGDIIRINDTMLKYSRFDPDKVQLAE